MNFKASTTNWKIAGYLLLFLFLDLINPVPANGQELEYKVKAGFLGKFAEFIDWPQNSNVHDSTKPFIIAVIGENPFGNLLEEIYGKSRIKNKPVKIKYLRGVKDLTGIDLLYIAPNEEKT